MTHGGARKHISIRPLLWLQDVHLSQGKIEPYTLAFEFVHPMRNVPPRVMVNFTPGAKGPGRKVSFVLGTKIRGS
jgi:hypothetical protein